MFRLFLLFSVIPILEIYLLVKAGTIIGPLPTICLLLAVSLTGARMIRNQGFEIVRRIQFELSQGRMPASELLNGILVMTGGVLLLTPGFFTDIVGLFFLFPVTRAVIGRLAARWIQQRLARGVITVIHPRP